MPKVLEEKVPPVGMTRQPVIPAGWLTDQRGDHVKARLRRQSVLLAVVSSSAQSWLAQEETQLVSSCFDDHDGIPRRRKPGKGTPTSSEP